MIAIFTSPARRPWALAAVAILLTIGIGVSLS
jgi:hypothetical protein